MTKPISLIIKETKTELIDICNKSGLPPVLLDMILQGIYFEVHALAERQMSTDEKEFSKNLNSKNQNIE